MVLWYLQYGSSVTSLLRHFVVARSAILSLTAGGPLFRSFLHSFRLVEFLSS